MKYGKGKKMSLSNRVFHIFNTIFWIVVMFIVLYPLYLVCISSISDPDAVMQGKVTWRPVDISFIGYKAVFQNREIWTSYLNSIFYVFSGVILSILVTLLSAYALTRPKLLGKKVINMYVLITMFINGGLIPTFLIVRNLGLYNSRTYMIIHGCITVWNLMVARTYIQNSIPEDLYEAAALDGASHFQYFFKVVLPLSKTIMGVLAVYYGVAKWNDYFTGLVYIRDRALLPLQTVLKGILATLQVDTSSILVEMAEDFESLEEAIRIAQVSKYCVIVVSTVPVVILYLFVQKYFEKGIMIGSLKG